MCCGLSGEGCRGFVWLLQAAHRQRRSFWRDELRVCWRRWGRYLARGREQRLGRVGGQVWRRFWRYRQGRTTVLAGIDAARCDLTAGRERTVRRSRRPLSGRGRRLCYRSLGAIVGVVDRLCRLTVADLQDAGRLNFVVVVLLAAAFPKWSAALPGAGDGRKLDRLATLRRVVAARSRSWRAWRWLAVVAAVGQGTRGHLLRSVSRIYESRWRGSERRPERRRAAGGRGPIKRVLFEVVLCELGPVGTGEARIVGAVLIGHQNWK